MLSLVTSLEEEVRDVVDSEVVDSEVSDVVSSEELLVVLMLVEEKVLLFDEYEVSLVLVSLVVDSLVELDKLDALVSELSLLVLSETLVSVVDVADELSVE